MLPSQVFGEMMGIPQEDRAADQPVGRDVGAVVRTPTSTPTATRLRGPSEGTIQMADLRHAVRGSAAATRQPTDLGSLLLHIEVEGRPDDRPRVRLLLRAARHRGQRHDPHHALVGAAGAARPSRPTRAPPRRSIDCIPSAVEEILRYANPLHYFRRTATADAVVGGQPIAAGDKLAMMYTSANRDEAVFADPDRFDISRSPEPAPVVRHRRALLPRRAPRPPRGPRLLRGAARPVPGDRAHRRTPPHALQPQQRAEGASGAAGLVST